MSGSFESVRWNACVHRLDLGLYSHPKEFWGMESEPMLTPWAKIPSTGKKFYPEEDRTHDAASSRKASHRHDQSSNSVTPGIWQGSHLSTNNQVTGVGRQGIASSDSHSPALEKDALLFSRNNQQNMESSSDVGDGLGTPSENP